MDTPPQSPLKRVRKFDEINLTALPSDAQMNHMLPDNLLLEIIYGSGLFKLPFVVSVLQLVCKKYCGLIRGSLSRLEVHTGKFSADQLHQLIHTYQQNLVYLNLAYSAVNDSLFEASSPISLRLRGISLHGSVVTDAALELLGKCSQLRLLSLAKTSSAHTELITDAGIAHLLKLSQLEYIDLTMTSVTDEALTALMRNNYGLTHLNIQFCQNITNEIFSHLTNLRYLSSLNVTACNRISDEGFSKFSGRACQTLQVLICSHIPSLSTYTLREIFLDRFPALRYLDMRSSSRRGRAIPHDLLTTAKEKIERFVYSHECLLQQGDDEGFPSYEQIEAQDHTWIV